MHIKPKDPKLFVTPAPGAYNPENADRDVKLSAPKYSFGIKPKADKPTHGPGIKLNIRVARWYMYFLAKNSNSGKFWRAFGYYGHLVYVVAIW
jgi:hypothetical protein